MRSKQRTKLEKDWHSAIAEWASSSNWLENKFGGHCVGVYQFHLDHVLGAQAKRKINLVSEKVGEWVVIPVPIDLHMTKTNNPLSICKGAKAFEKQFGTRINLWLDMVFKMKQDGYNLPFSDDVIKAFYND